MYLTKDQLRTKFKQIRKNLPKGLCTSSSQQIILQLRHLLPKKPGTIIGLYLPLPGEPDIMPLFAWAKQHQLEIALPHQYAGVWQWRLLKTQPNQHWHPLRLNDHDLSDQTTPLVGLAPGLAFSKQGWRLGFGHGIYDRLFQQPTPAIRIGVAFSNQLRANLPHHRWDVPMDIIVTPTKIYMTGQRVLTKKQRSFSCQTQFCYQ